MEKKTLQFKNMKIQNQQEI